MALKEMPKVGDKVRYVGGEEMICVTDGVVYVIERIDRVGDAVFIDDCGSRSCIQDSYGHCNFRNFELVTEEEEAEPKPDVTDLIANLARRLGDIEKHLGFDRPLTTRISALESHNAQQANEINELYRAVADLEAKI